MKYRLFLFCCVLAIFFVTSCGKGPSGIIDIDNPSGTGRIQPVTNGHEYVDLGVRYNGNKILFATMNIGASSPEDFGDYFAWGETSKRYTRIEGKTVIGKPFDLNYAPYHTGSDRSSGWSKYIPIGSAFRYFGCVVDNKLTLDPEDDVASVLWGGDWRMPDREHLAMLTVDSVVDCRWVSNYNSTNTVGLLITGKGDYSSASIFLPAAGWCFEERLIGCIDSFDGLEYHGSYWSRTVDLRVSADAWIYFFSEHGEPSYENIIAMGTEFRESGLPVRPVIVVPDNE